jgi:hypothetical protein
VARDQRSTAERALLGTSVLTPTLRYHPSIVAQAYACEACHFWAPLALKPDETSSGRPREQDCSVVQGRGWSGYASSSLRAF